MPIEQEANTVIEYLKLIPDFVWVLFAVVVGAILSWLPLRWQLKHDSEEKEKERKMSLRRDVYLSAVAKIGQQLSYLVSFYNTSEASPGGYNEALKQIDVIGSDETIAALTQFNDHMAETFIELIPKREEIRFLEKRSKLLLKLVGQDIELKKNFQEYKKIYDKIIELTYELAEKCQQKTQLAEELLTPVIVAIRKEMSVPFDEAAYRSMMEISDKKWKENTEKYITSMKKTYQQGIQSVLTEVNHLTTDDTDNE